MKYSVEVGIVDEDELSIDLMINKYTGKENTHFSIYIPTIEREEMIIPISQVKKVAFAFRQMADLLESEDIEK